MKNLTAKNVAVFGATSAIAQEVARLFARRGCGLFLVGRDKDKLTAVQQDLRVRGAGNVAGAAVDLTHAEKHEQLIEQASQFLGGIDVAVIAHGVLGNQKQAEQDWDQSRAILDVNFMSVVSLVTHLVNRFERVGAGQLVLLGSVAGDRGRRSNYVYGTAKGAAAIFLQGVRQRLAPKGIQVLVVKLGFVDTPMTSDLPKSPLFASPHAVARGILRAVDQRKSVVYLPWFWRWVMIVIRVLPDPVFNRLPI